MNTIAENCLGRLHETLKLKLRGEFFNLFSGHFYTPVFPTATMTSSNFAPLYPVGGDASHLFNPRTVPDRVARHGLSAWGA